MADLGSSGTIVSATEFKQNPISLQRKWTLEIAAAKDNVKKWVEQAERANKRYLGEVAADGTGGVRSRLNLYHANINILLSILYGQVPKVDVSRRFADAEDDVARVSAEALQRHLNTDIEDNQDDFASEIKDALKDWKITGFGLDRLRYEAEFKTVQGEPARVSEDGRELAPEVPDHEEKASESIATEYVHWKDFLWSPCRRWKEARWVAFGAEMSRDEAVKRFGKKIGGRLPLQKRMTKDGQDSDEMKDAWSRAYVWEIWSKEDKTVYWFCEGFDRILDSKSDPLGLKGFFPCPRPLFANTTTSKFIPKPDLELDKHLYDEIDDIADRLRKLLKAARITFAYDKATPELSRLLEEAVEGQGIAVASWGTLSEKGGLAGVMQFVPLDMLVKAMDVLTAKLAEKIQLLYQATGLSDVVRGEQTRQETATTSRIKAGFASTRLQTDQDEVSRFASDLQRLRAEIISLHYSPQTIVERSNLERVELDPVTKQPNLDLISKAVELIKSDFWQYRVEVKSDAIALRDYAALKQERVEAIGSLAALFQQAIPMVQIAPGSAPFLLEIGKWLIAATKGSQQLEAAFDRFAGEAEKAAAAPQPQQQPDPKAQMQLQTAQVKATAEIGKAKAQMAQTAMDAQVHQQQARMDMAVAQQKHELDVDKLARQTEAEAQRAALAFTHQNNPGGTL